MASNLARAESASAMVSAAFGRLAELGGWPDAITPDTLTARIPDAERVDCSGFDAGIACALELIPRDRQGLAAALHAAWTPAAVEQIRAEVARGLGADDATTWWLAACAVCTEGGVDVDAFSEQLDRFQVLASAPSDRLAVALAELDVMRASYIVEDGLPMAVRDGGMQGAYVDGFDVAGAFDERRGLYFLGTFRNTLGLEGFTWAEPGNPDADTVDGRMGRSGPVHGSTQFVKCRDRAEFAAAVAAVRLGD